MERRYEVFSYHTTRQCGRSLQSFASEKITSIRSIQIISTRYPISFRKVLSVIETRQNKKIMIKPLEEEQTVELLRKRAPDSGTYARDAVGRMAAYYNKKGLVGNYNILKMLIKREPVQVEEWVEWAIEQTKGK